MSFFKLDSSGHAASTFAVRKSTASGKKASVPKANPKVIQVANSELDESQFTKF